MKFPRTLLISNSSIVIRPHSYLFSSIHHLTIRLYTTSPSTTQTQPTPLKYTSKTNVPTSKKEILSLLKNGGEGGRWNLTPGGQGIERSFKFGSFKNTWDFMNQIAKECKVVKHHPEWSNVYNTAFIRWTTHNPPGLSKLDIQMARFCDYRALIEEEIISSALASSSLEEGIPSEEVGNELVDIVAEKGKECCSRPKSEGKNQVEVKEEDK